MKEALDSLCRNHPRKDRRSKSFEKISRSPKGRRILRRCKGFTARASKGLKLRREQSHRSEAEGTIRSARDIAYRVIAS